MNIHENARLTPRGRERLVRSVLNGNSLQTAAAGAGVCERTVRKWVARFKAEGAAGLLDRSSRPHRFFRPTPPEIVAKVEALRRERWTGKRIALELSLSPTTVSRILRRLGLNRMRDLEPAEPVRRYEQDHPGDRIHLDIKKLGRFDRVGHRITGDRKGQSNGRGIGWEFVHVSIDDASRLAFSRDHAQREGRQRRRLPQGRRRLLSKPGDHSPARHDRQRLLLQSQSLPRRLRRSRPEACAN